MQLLNSLLLLLSCDGTIMIIFTTLITMITTKSVTMTIMIAWCLCQGFLTTRQYFFLVMSRFTLIDVNKMITIKVIFAKMVIMTLRMRQEIWVVTDHMSWRWLEMAPNQSHSSLQCHCNEPSSSSQKRSRLCFVDEISCLCVRDFFTLWQRDFCFHFVSRFRRRWRLAGGGAARFDSAEIISL